MKVRIKRGRTKSRSYLWGRVLSQQSCNWLVTSCRRNKLIGSSLTCHPPSWIWPAIISISDNILLCRSMLDVYITRNNHCGGVKIMIYDDRWLFLDIKPHINVNHICRRERVLSQRSWKWMAVWPYAQTLLKPINYLLLYFKLWLFHKLYPFARTNFFYVGVSMWFVCREGV